MNCGIQHALAEIGSDRQGPFLEKVSFGVSQPSEPEHLEHVLKRNAFRAGLCMLVSPIVEPHLNRWGVYTLSRLWPPCST